MSKVIFTDLQTINEQIKPYLLQRMPSSGDYTTAIDNFGIYRRDENNLYENCFYNPMVSIIVQGSKQSLIGSKKYHYGEGSYLIASIDVPAMSSIIQVSPEKPFLSMALSLDNQLISQLIAEHPHLSTIKPEPFNGICIKSIESTELDLINAFLRLLMLLENTERIPILSPMIIKEIHYLLLIGPFGHQLRSIHTNGSQSHYVALVIDWLKRNYRQSITLEELANKANMSSSTFHRYFKTITTLTPLQYQKQLRLYEARRLMLSENMSASNAGFSVGYESATQFNREYKRLFGQPPYKDIMKMR